MGQTILNDATKADIVKMTKYDNTMQSFATQRYKVIMKSTPKSPTVIPNENDAKEKLREKTIDSLPTNLQSTAKHIWNESEITGINALFPSVPMEKYPPTVKD